MDIQVSEKMNVILAEIRQQVDSSVDKIYRKKLFVKTGHNFCKCPAKFGSGKNTQPCQGHFVLALNPEQVAEIKVETAVSLGESGIASVEEFSCGHKVVLNKVS